MVANRDNQHHSTQRERQQQKFGLGVEVSLFDNNNYVVSLFYNSWVVCGGKGIAKSAKKTPTGNFDFFPMFYLESL